MNHGHGAHGGAARVVDPVCGMTIDPADAAGVSEAAGTTYHFCSLSCKKKFDADPTRFGPTADRRGSCQSGHGCCC
jgi:P-type Cu+ transporter